MQRDKEVLDRFAGAFRVVTERFDLSSLPYLYDFPPPPRLRVSAQLFDAGINRFPSGVDTDLLLRRLPR